MRHVALLARRASVGFQNGIDELSHRRALRPRSAFAETRLRNGTAERLAHQPPVHPELARYASNAADAELVFASKLFE